MEETVHKCWIKARGVFEKTPTDSTVFISIMYSVIHSHEEPAVGQMFEQVICSEIVSRLHYSRKIYLFNKVK